MITHPDVITYVLQKVIARLGKNGKIIITDGPETYSSFQKILDHNPVSTWRRMADEQGIRLEIIDLREDEWIQDKGVTIERKKLKGDPGGNTEVRLVLNRQSPEQRYHVPVVASAPL